MSYFSQLGLSGSGAPSGLPGGWRNGDVAEGGETDRASTHILCTGKIVDGNIEMDISMLPWLDPRPEGSRSIELPLQSMIDEAAEASDYEDYMADVEFWRHGC
jgi:hypothetical protein